MARNGRGGVFGEHVAGAEGRRRHLLGVLRGAGEPHLPADPKTIRAFIEHEVTARKKPATVRRYIATIGRAHIGAGLLNPCSSEAVRLALKRTGRETSARQSQARALGWKEIKEFIGSAGQGLQEDMERALLCVAYETLARRSELVALEVWDIEFWPNGTGQALIRRCRTDAAGQGRVSYLSRKTVRWLKLWLEHANIAEGLIFRRLIGRDQIGGALNPASIAPILKRVAQWIGDARAVHGGGQWSLDAGGAPRRISRRSISISPPSRRLVDGCRRGYRYSMQK